MGCLVFLGIKPCGHVVSDQLKVCHSDRLGSVRWVTDGGQNILVSYVYEGFGKIVGQNGGGGGPYQFCGLWGYRNDWDAGLLHVGARYYEFDTGRFVQKDTEIGTVFIPLTFNLYIYTMSNPIDFVDPKGKCPWKVIGAVIITLAGVFFIDEWLEHGGAAPPVAPPSGAHAGLFVGCIAIPNPYGKLAACALLAIDIIENFTGNDIDLWPLPWPP